MQPNRLYFGDCLEIMQEYISDESVDLIYLDPPFNSKRMYNAFIGGAQFVAFEDTWRWHEAIDDFHAVAQRASFANTIEGLRKMLGEGPDLAYLSYMANRLVECRRVLKPTGSIYLHCDSTKSHYLKAVMDGVFGQTNFRSEIIWRRTGAHNKLSRQYGPIHDTILFYSVSDTFTFRPGRTPYTQQYIDKYFTGSDEIGPYQRNSLTGPGIRHGDSGKPWRGYDPTPKNRNWAIPKSLRSHLPNGGDGMTSQEKLESLHAQGLIVFPDKVGGQPRYKQRIGDGVLYQDIWAYQPGTQGALYGTEEGIDQDVKWLDSSEEKLGYPTQKPVGLLHRIIESSSCKGDVVLDPFCGCGTTIHAAQNLSRRWIGIDICVNACAEIQSRLERSFAIYWEDIEFLGMPKTINDAQNLAQHDPFKFERWAAALTPGIEANKKQRGDKGIDGRGRFPLRKGVFVDVVTQVKSGHTNPSAVQAFNEARRQVGADLGIFTCFQGRVTNGMRDAAANAGRYQQWPTIQIYTVEDFFANRKPDLPIAV